uniref:Uncharacterized protein n=1 Tax=Chelonoidis abingdonii TaxID=106734 RepID=A0A8C0HD72_CHEAB
KLHYRMPTPPPNWNVILNCSDLNTLKLHSFANHCPGPGCVCSVVVTCFCFSPVQCLWCNARNTCMDYPVRSILPSSSLCPLYDARWGVCWSRY